ncbi:MAG: M36 family metallopeptidase [Acidobacteriota bacterium]
MHRPSFPLKTLSVVAALAALLFTGGLWAVGPDAGEGHSLRDFDARVRYNQTFKVDPTAGQQQRIAAMSAAVPEMAVTFEETTGATRTVYNQTGYLTGPRSGEPLAIAKDYLQTQLGLLGLDGSDFAGHELTDLVPSRVTGASHVYLRQVHQGIPVYNGQLHVNVNREGRILGVNNSFLPKLALAVNRAQPGLRAVEAVRIAAEHLGLPVDIRALTRPNGVRQTTRLRARGVSLDEVEASLMWLPVRRGEARLVWNFNVRTPDGIHHYDFNIDAHDGRVWTRFDWTRSDSYRVYPIPAESPSHVSPVPPADGRTLVSDPASTAASPLGWHDTGTTSYTIMRGNNAHAFPDTDGNGAPPASETSCGASLDCDFSINLNQAPSQYQPAATANAFYWNNILHDIQYLYGFDEAAGNFQQNNFGNGGAGGDYVNVSVQSGNFRCPNNAFFSTPPDGGNGAMLMCLWTSPNPDRDGDLDNGIMAHEFGHGVSIRQVGGPSNSSCLNNNQQAGEGWSDLMSLMYTHEVGDQGTDPRGIGTYALNQPTSGAGIRTQRYSTNPAVNNHTYESIQGMAIPHGVGEVWAQAYWEVYWALVDQYGFDPDLYDASGGSGNQRAMFYFNEGLKNTACSPTFVDNRDGIIQAATDNFGGADVCLIWETFAAFGLGEDAVSGGSGSTNPTNGFAVPASCACQPSAVADAGPDQSICLGDSATVGTPALAGHSYSWAPGGQSTAQISVSPSTSTTYTVTATTTCGSAQDSATVTVDSGTGGGLNDDFEGSVAGWTTSGLWHVATNSTCASPQNGYTSPVNAFYYGQDSTCNYDSGAANSGSLTSPVITGITASSTLTFQYLRQVESFSGAFDSTVVEIVTGSGATTVFALDSSDASTSVWESSGAISLSAFAGQSIQVRFTFDTSDNVDNDQIGWFVDDVVVTGDSPCTPSNTPPTVTISSPADPTTVTQGASVTFTGTATDAEDGTLTGSLSWSSNLDGAIGSGGSFSTSSLSIGTHTVTASVTDSGSLSGSDTVTVTVNAPTNDVPNVNISSPADPTTVTEGTSVTFTGTATDTEDGTLTGSLSWSSNLDGVIGAGGSFSTSSLSVGAHTVTASVTDSGGATGSDTVSVTVNADTPGCSDCIDWSVTGTVSYSTQDASADVTVEDGGDTLLLEQNTWRRTTDTFTVTSNTVLEFDFSSTDEGEIHGIGFDEDDTISNAVRVFQVHGTQNWGSANHDFDNYVAGSGFVTYSIPVGQYYTGSGLRLVLVNDKDAGALTNDSRFRNVRIYEDVPVGCAVNDDFEGGAAAWINGAAATCTTGDFVVGTPTQQTNGGVTTQVGGDHTTGSGNAIFTATNTSAGNADVDGGTCILESPVFSVAEASVLRVWYFHGQRDAGDDAGDLFRLEVSTNGGSSYTSIVDLGDVTSNAAWTEATSAIPAGSSVMLRVQVADATADGDLVEAGIDDLSICPSP